MAKFPGGFANCSSCDVFEPSCQRTEGKDEVVFEIDVKGYNKSQLHVKTEKGRLIIWGERRAGEISLRKTIQLKRQWKKKEIRPFLFGQDVHGAKLTITIKKGTVWSDVKNSFSTLNSTLKKSYSIVKARHDLAYLLVVALLLIQIVVMIKCTCAGRAKAPVLDVG